MTVYLSVAAQTRSISSDVTKLRTMLWMKTINAQDSRAQFASVTGVDSSVTMLGSVAKHNVTKYNRFY